MKKRPLAGAAFVATLTMGALPAIAQDANDNSVFFEHASKRIAMPNAKPEGLSIARDFALNQRETLVSSHRSLFRVSMETPIRSGAI